MDAGGRATHDYMDIGDRAKQEARAEEQLPKAANNPASCKYDGYNKSRAILYQRPLLIALKVWH